MSIKNRLANLEGHADQVNDCPDCQHFNRAAYILTAAFSVGKHISEMGDLPEYRCATCKKVPQSNQGTRPNDYERMILALQAERRKESGFGLLGT